jgi:hypothetical protein
MNYARMEANDFRVTPVDDWEEARVDGRVAAGTPLRYLRRTA